MIGIDKSHYKNKKTRLDTSSKSDSFSRFSNSYQPFRNTMPRETVILECTEARAENKPVSRYMTTRNKKTKQDRVEKIKFNRFLNRRTLHREIKN